VRPYGRESALGARISLRSTSALPRSKCATALFTEQGYEATSIETVLEKSGVSLGVAQGCVTISQFT
jgi:hypothetical protein